MNITGRRPRILLAASGCVAAIKFGALCHSFSEWADVKGVVTQTAARFIDAQSIPKNVCVYTEKDEWSHWSRIGDPVLHIQLQKWAEIMVIAPLSANTLAKIAEGLCDNLLTCIVRAWDYTKPFFIAPSMNPATWQNPFTERHLEAVDELGVTLIRPSSNPQPRGGSGTGAMAEVSHICGTIRLFYQMQQEANRAGGSDAP